MLSMRDEKGEDHKIIVVSAGKLPLEYENITNYNQPSDMLIQ